MVFQRCVKCLATACCGMALANAATAQGEETGPAATPYRPTVSNPAALSAPGWLEVELGWQRIQGGSDKRRDSFPVLAKLAFTDDWGLLLGGELGVRRADMDGVLHRGNGDTVLTLKHRIPTASEGQAWGIEAGYKAPTAEDTIGSGKADFLLNGIFSLDFSGSHLDLNLGATRLGAVASDESRYQYNWAMSLSRNLGPQWNVFGELSGTSQRGTPALSQALAGVSYAFNKRLVFDAGASSGLASAAQDWTAFAGMAVLVGKLW